MGLPMMPVRFDNDLDWDLDVNVGMIEAAVKGNFAYLCLETLLE